MMCIVFDALKTYIRVSRNEYSTHFVMAYHVFIHFQLSLWFLPFQYSYIIKRIIIILSKQTLTKHNNYVIYDAPNIEIFVSVKR